MFVCVYIRICEYIRTHMLCLYIHVHVFIYETVSKNFHLKLHYLVHSHESNYVGMTIYLTYLFLHFNNRVLLNG